MRIALMPDSFKGTLSAIKISEIMRSAIESIVDAQTIMLPIADGGEGSIDAISLALSGNKIHKTVRDAYLNEIDAYYYLSGDTAIVEVATCIGLPLISIHNPALTSSYGVGELIKDAMDKGAHRIILALGGSSTNDGGCGIASALGVRFSKSSGGFLPTGGTLSQIEDIDIAQLDKRINNVEFVSMCDIDNPLYGEQGAAYVYARQKGADDEMIKSLDKGLRHLALISEKSIFACKADFAGAGSAGGIGYGSKIFLNARIESGIETVLDLFQFDKLDVDYIFTGEGKIDEQSLRGKAVIGVASRAKARNIPVICFVGDNDLDNAKAYDKGITAIFSTNRLAVPFSQAKESAEYNLFETVQNVVRILCNSTTNK